MKKSFNFVIAIIALLIASTQARANDSAIQGAGGTPSALGSLKKVAPLKGEHPNIRMVRERVSMTVGSKYYDVVADFVFHNNGAGQRVLMGFPEGAGGDILVSDLNKKSAFKNFRTLVDGRLVTARRIVAKSNADDEEFEAYWVKSVRFEKYQTRHILVSYRAPLGGNSTGQSFTAYDFTGGNWKGKVEESVLSVHFAAPGVYEIDNSHDSSKSKQWRKGSTFYYRWRNWQAQSEFLFLFTTTLPGALSLVGDEKELSRATAPNASTLVVNSPNKNFDPWSAPVRSHPAFVLRDGRVFASLNWFAGNLRYQLQTKAVEKKQDANYRDGLRWDSASKTAWWQPGGRRAAGPELKFQVGQQHMTVGARDVTLSAAPFNGVREGYGTLYVPLLPVLEALGGKMKINTKTRRVWFEILV